MTTMEDNNVVVIGAGPAGLTAAYELVKRDIAPVVIEKSGIVGGIARTEQYRDFHYDMGGHRFFTKSEEVNKLWHEILAEDFLTRSRLSRIYYKKTFFNYPLKPLNTLAGLGMIESVRIAASYVRWTLFPYREEETFEQWVTNRFGKRLFDIFFKSYTEKVWGIPCSELRAEWAAQRIKDLSLKTAVLTMFIKPRTTIKTLIDSFHYPRLGPGMFWRKVRSIIEERGARVLMDSDVVAIQRSGSRIDAIEVRRNGSVDTIRGSKFISSMPVTELIQKLSPAPPSDVLEAASKLKYRDFLTVCLVVDKPGLFPDNWIYIHEPDVQVGRIQNFGNWSPDMVPDKQKSSLGLEYFCNEGDEMWTCSDEQLIEQGKRELERLGLVAYEDVSDGCVFRVPKSYPVYDAGYREVLESIRQYVDSLENIQTIGRNGLHRYNNQDHAMLTGMLAVRNAFDGENFDLWSVNTEQEYHEEIREEPEPVLEELITASFSKLDRVAMGMATGTTLGVLLMAATFFLVAKGGTVVGPNLSLLGHYFPGYQATLFGGFIGFAYAFVVGFGGGWLFALIRNAVLLLYFAMIRRSAERHIILKLLSYI